MFSLTLRLLDRKYSTASQCTPQCRFRKIAQILGCNRSLQPRHDAHDSNISTSPFIKFSNHTASNNLVNVAKRTVKHLKEAEWVSALRFSSQESTEQAIKGNAEESYSHRVMETTLRHLCQPAALDEPLGSRQRCTHLLFVENLFQYCYCIALSLSLLLRGTGRVRLAHSCCMAMSGAMTSSTSKAVDDSRALSLPAVGKAGHAPSKKGYGCISMLAKFVTISQQERAL